MQLRDEHGTLYDAPRGARDATTRLRELAARYESVHGRAVLVAPVRWPLKRGPLRRRLRGWEIIVTDGQQPPGRAAFARVRRFREAAAVIRGTGLGITVFTRR